MNKLHFGDNRLLKLIGAHSNLKQLRPRITSLPAVVTPDTKLMKILHSYGLVLVAAIPLLGCRNSERHLVYSKTTHGIQGVSSMHEPGASHSGTLLANHKVLIAGGMRENQSLMESGELFDP